MSAALGFDTSDYSFGYVATWAGAEDVSKKIRASGGRIQRTADQIINDLEEVTAS